MWPPQQAIRANYCRNSLERTAISLTNYKYQSPVHLFPGRLRPARWIDAGLIEQSDDISLEALEGGLGDSFDVQRAACLPFSILNPKLVAMTTMRNLAGNSLRVSWADA